MPERYGWRLHAHPLLLAQLQRLQGAANRLAAGDPFNRAGAPDMRVLAALNLLMFEQVPANPLHDDHRIESALPPHAPRWRCACFGGGRFGLYFQPQAAARRIVYGWIDDASAARQPAAGHDEAYVLAGAASTVTAKGRVTLPQPVREAVQLPFGGRLNFWLHGTAILAGQMPAIRPAASLARPRAGLDHPPPLARFPIPAPRVINARN